MRLPYGDPEIHTTWDLGSLRGHGLRTDNWLTATSATGNKQGAPGTESSGHLPLRLPVQNLWPQKFFYSVPEKYAVGGKESPCSLVTTLQQRPVLDVQSLNSVGIKETKAYVQGNVQE